MIADSVTVEEKLAAWLELLDAYNEEDLPKDSYVFNRQRFLELRDSL